MYSASVKRIQDLSVIEPNAPSIPPRYLPRTVGDEAARAAGQRGAGMFLTGKSEVALLDWIPVNDHLYVAKFQGPNGVRKDICAKRRSLACRLQQTAAPVCKRTISVTSFCSQEQMVRHFNSSR